MAASTADAPGQRDDDARPALAQARDELLAGVADTRASPRR